jgi:hypothetical protein
MTRVIASVVWKPFDIRFEDTIEQIGSHQNLVKQELSLLQLNATKSSAEIIHAANNCNGEGTVGAWSKNDEESMENHELRQKSKNCNSTH